MNLIALHQQLFAKPWAITRAGWQAAFDLYEKEPWARIAKPAAVKPSNWAVADADTGETFLTVSSRGYDLFDNPIPGLTIADGVAHIPVKGVLMKGVGIVEKTFGVTDVNDVRYDIESAHANAEVERTELHFDSPGGSVAGIEKLGADIARMSNEKEITAVAEGMLCSAAYWLAAGCREIRAEVDADIGSIGVYSAVEDYSRMYQNAGVEVTLATTGKYKGMGYPGTPLTAEQKALLQSEVDNIFGRFKAHIAKYRPKVDADSMQGQSFMADDAQRRGLIDAII